jgi:hypothetical protein
MKILFEEYSYNTNKVECLLPEHYFKKDKHSCKPIVVGYYHNTKSNAPVIILPKVFLNENDLFFIQELDPCFFIEDDYLSLIDDYNTRNQIANFLFECSSWFYFSIKKYYYKFKESVSLYKENINLIDCSHPNNLNTELDIIASLIKFNNENKELFTFIKKTSNAQNNKTDWNRTFRKSSPFICSSGTPVYLKTYTKKKQINIEEELLVLFFSLLKSLEKKYNIKLHINPFYKLFTEKEFSVIYQRGTFYLRSIRFKYFNDRLLRLYGLLYAYFEKVEHSSIRSELNDYLIVKDYHLVFQDMVDELLTDANINPSLKYHKDNKELDHIYKAKSFFEGDNIYFIGDSKYYKKGNTIETKSVYKQFTYAKNVIQFNIDLFNESKSYSQGLKYRDELTEGYNITPNFFIRGIVENLNCVTAELIPDPRQDIKRQINCHFEDRLFDRDTLITYSYLINFLFVLWSYISNKGRENDKFKKEAKKVFRNELIQHFLNNYTFSEVHVIGDINDFIINNFYYLNGKIYRPANFDEKNAFILALKKEINPNEFLDSNVQGKYKLSNYKLT